MNLRRRISLRIDGLGGLDDGIDEARIGLDRINRLQGFPADRRRRWPHCASSGSDRSLRRSAETRFEHSSPLGTARAEERIPKLVARWSERTKLEPTAVRIVEQRARWGSCSPSGVVPINWRIIQASTRLVEYVVLHELVHLTHAEHGTRFWRALGSVMPDYEDRRAQLRALGPRLVW